MNKPRNEHPNPQMAREKWLNLNGEWDFKYDDADVGVLEKWFLEGQYDKKIIVPYVCQSELSQINDQEVHDIVWYQCRFNLPEDMVGQRILLHFGAVDYKADVWINGQHVVTHEGGHISFAVEITKAATEKDNLLVVRAQDDIYDLELPRGKQFWKTKSESIYYTRSTGIWQTVWLEAVGRSYIQKIWLTPDIDKKMIHLEYEINHYSETLELTVEIKLQEHMLIQDTLTILNSRGKREFFLDQRIPVEATFEMWTWTPERPVLFDMRLKLKDKGVCIDTVKTYFGMRKVSIVDGKFMLNNKPYYQKLLLDQGYWEQSLLTAPTDADFVKDIQLAKEMGFNGVRKHQKIEDPRYLYHADKMGFLVWGENAAAFIYSRKFVHLLTAEWMEMIARDYNHPCIVAWTPINESWGTDGIMNNKDEQAYATALYYLTKSIDQTRPVISNDGWDHTKTDLLTVHDYEWRKEVLVERYESVEKVLSSKFSGRGAIAQGWTYENQPIIVSELGGISYQKGSSKGWGYSSASSEEDFILRYYNVISALLESPLVQGFVYTQLTDIEQEINGLLTYARESKVDLNIIRQINEGKWKPS